MFTEKNVLFGQITKIYIEKTAFQVLESYTLLFSESHKMCLREHNFWDVWIF